MRQLPRKAIKHPISVDLSSGHRSFTVDAKGNAFVGETGTGPGAGVRWFKVSERQLDQLRQALEKERFFELGSEYGDHVPDGGAAFMRITQGQKSKMVTLIYLGNWEREGHYKLAEAQRAQRIWNLIQAWSK